MESNYQTISHNIFDVATDLTDNKKYTELNRTDNYKSCDHLVVNHIKKQFFFTKKSTENHLQKLLKLID